MLLEVKVWVHPHDPEPWRAIVPNRATSRELMDRFITDHWWRMNFYQDGKVTHAIKFNSLDPNDPLIVEVHRFAESA